MFEIIGKYTTAKVFADYVEETAVSQIYELCNHPVFKDESISIMPDVHAGAGCVVGLTATLKEDKVIPNLIGVDIGCGVLVIKLNNRTIDFDVLNSFIKTAIPFGSNINSNCQTKLIDDLIDATCERIEDNKDLYHKKSIGSLGGGNHFIEVNKDDNGSLYLVIHSGSRNFGHRVATYYQNKAIKTCKNTGFDKDLTYLEGDLAKNYLQDMRNAQAFAKINRMIIASQIMTHMSFVEAYRFDTIHNYISDDNIIRKGSVSAKLGEQLIIPINMRDGSIIAEGKGNAEYNNSAPHGAGRLMPRGQAKRELNFEEFKEQMKGIYTTSVKEGTLDEAPNAYKPIDTILANINETVTVKKIIKPIYNFKA